MTSVFSTSQETAKPFSKSGCIILHSSQQRMRGPVALHSHQHLACFKKILSLYQMYSSTKYSFNVANVEHFSICLFAIHRFVSCTYSNH